MKFSHQQFKSICPSSSWILLLWSLVGRFMDSGSGLIHQNPELVFLIDSDLEFITSWCQVSFPQSLLTHHWTVQDAFLYADDSDEIIEELLSREKKKADRTRRRSEQQDGQVQDDLDSITKGEKWKDLHMTIAASRSVPRNSLCRRRSGVCFMKEKYFWKFDAVSFV